MKIAIGEKSKHEDAVYKSKKIGRNVAELIGGTERGAKIRVWTPAGLEEQQAEAKLPHIFTVTPDGKYELMNEVHFSYFSNAAEEYARLTTSARMIDLAWRNR